MDYTWVVTGLVALFTFLLVHTWLKRHGLPPGPFPLPFLGNILDLRKPLRTDTLIMNWSKKYGGVFTIWAGMKPTIVATDWDSIKEALITQRNTFSGRVTRLSSKLLLDGHNDVIISDFGPEWETLRKLASLAIRKYVGSDKLPTLVQDVVEQCVPIMLKKSESFDPNETLYLIIFNILASTAFGERYGLEDPEFVALMKNNDAINNEFTTGLPSDFFPSLRYLFYFSEKKLIRLFDEYMTVMRGKYEEHKKSYISGVVRDFTDAILSAKEEAEVEDKSTAQYLTDENLTLLLFDLFSAGTDTTRMTFHWILLYISYYPEIQEKIRKEVFDNIGERVPVQEDKDVCPYTIAVLTEILRVRPIISFTLEHKAICDTKLNGYDIPKGTGIIFHIMSQHKSEENWTDAEVFKPERFLEDDGTFTKSRLTGYLPFGLGRRGCPGEKLAKANLFLMVTRFLQLVRFSLENGPGSADLEPQNIIFMNVPKPFKIQVEKL